eukprot:3768884-Karenia_brevis.AAC.1
MGPSASDKQWLDAFLTWQSRSGNLASSSIAASFASLVYNVRSLSVLTYLAQFLPVPSRIYPKERAIIHKILK